MRPVARNIAVIGIVVIAVGAGFVGGWYADPAGSTSSRGTTSTLAVIAAGTLGPNLPSFASNFANQTPGVQAPLSAQLYEGSLAAATALTQLGQPYDAFVAADFRVIPQHLEPTTASWEVVFAADPMVLAYDPSVPALAGINTSNWASVIVQPGITLGTPNASSDPLGYNAIFSIELEDSLDDARGSFYSHFYTGSMGSFAGPVTAVTKIVPETQASAVLSTGTADTYLIYRSYAIADHLSYVELSPHVNLAAYDPTSVTNDTEASTTILSGTTTKTVEGAPVLFAATVPNTAPNVPLGVAFIAYLLSNQTSATWAADGFSVISPAWTDHPNAIPAALAGFAPESLPTVPAYLAALY
ncbi:MAG: substrate-binding domain-containing protein [Thermoplasmata archaeon]